MSPDPFGLTWTSARDQMIKWPECSDAEVVSTDFRDGLQWFSFQKSLRVNMSFGNDWQLEPLWDNQHCQNQPGQQVYCYLVGYNVCESGDAMPQIGDLKRSINELWKYLRNVAPKTEINWYNFHKKSSISSMAQPQRGGALLPSYIWVGQNSHKPAI